MDRIVFITPTLEHTGSEVALFNLIVKLKGREVIVITRTPGPLSRMLPSNVRFNDYYTYKKGLARRTIIERVRNRILKRNPATFHAFLDTVVGDGRNALFYVNTIILPEVTNYLADRHFRYVLHVHELQQIYVHVSKQDLEKMITHADFVFTSSNISKDVVMTLGRDKDIAVSNPGIHLEKIKTSANQNLLRKELNISDDSFVIIMSGTLDPNKNAEAFLSIGKSLLDRGHKIHLLWIGANIENGYQYFIKKKVSRMGLEKYFSFLGRIDGDSYYDYLNLGNCLVLPSFNESFSMVIVEALALGKPVVSFCSGGPQEIIDSDEVGILISNYDVDSMVAALQRLIEGRTNFNPQRAMARAAEFSINVVFNDWYRIINGRYFS